MFKGKISWSELRQYNTCSYQFFLKNTNVENLQNVNKQAKTKGLSFHQFCEHYHENWSNGIPNKNKKFDKESFQWFHEFELMRFGWCKENKSPWKPLHIEKTFESDDFICIVDRIDDNGDGTFMMIEYKNKPGLFDKQQLAFEHIVITENYEYCKHCNEFVPKGSHPKVHANPIVFSSFGIIYAEHPDDNYYKKPNKTSLNSMQKKMSVTLMGIRGGHFIAKSGFACFYCDFGKLGQCNKKGIDLNLCTKCSISLQMIDNT